MLAIVAIGVAAPLAAAKTSPAKANLMKAVTAADSQAAKLVKRSGSCAAASGQRAITMRVRAAQTRGLAKATPSSLRLRQFRISVHTRRLAVALTRCTGAAPGPATAVPGRPGAPGPRGPVGLPGTPGPAGSDGSSSQRAGLNLTLLGSELDLSGLLGGSALPPVISLVDLSELTSSGLCSVRGTTCVGVDVSALRAAITGATGDLLADLPLLGGLVNPLLDTVTDTLAAGNLNALLDVRRTGDGTIVVTARPDSALALVSSLLGSTGALPPVAIGEIQVRV
ncbi:MAG: collagen-like protein [Solirubrobacterales bacterium]